MEIGKRVNKDQSVGTGFPSKMINKVVQSNEKIMNKSHVRKTITIDLASGYRQLPMHPTDQEKTAFTTPNGHYEFIRLKGLKV